MRNTDDRSPNPRPRQRLEPIGGLVQRTLLRIVRHCTPEQEAAIAGVFERAADSAPLQAELQQVLCRLGLSLRTFAALVVLSTFDPEPLTPGDLAFHLGVRRTGIAGILKPLTDDARLVRTHTAWRRGAAFIGLSAHGRSLAARAVRVFLKTAERLAHTSATAAGPQSDPVEAGRKLHPPRAGRRP